MIVAGDGKPQTKLDFGPSVIYKSICQLQGQNVDSEERKDNAKLIMMAPDMYRTLYAIKYLGWDIYQTQKQTWCFYFETKEDSHQGVKHLSFDVPGDSLFPVWTQELIDIFEKAVANEVQV